MAQFSHRSNKSFSQSIVIAIFAFLSVMIIANHCEAQGRSYKPGIVKTQRALDQMDKLIEQNIEEQTQEEINLVNDLSSALGSVGGSVSQNPSSTDILITDIKTEIYFAETGKSVGNKDYSEILEHAAEALAEVWRDSDLWGGRVVSSGSNAISIAADLYRLQTITNEQLQYAQTRFNLWQSLLNLEGKDPASLAWWKQTLHNLKGDPSVDRTAYKQWLQTQQINQPDLMKHVVQNAPKNVQIVDPNDLSSVSSIDGINPDFIEALRRQNLILQAMQNSGPTSELYAMAMNVDKYPDGSYIPMMGKPRGLPPFHLPSAHATSPNHNTNVFSTTAPTHGSRPQYNLTGVWLHDSGLSTLSLTQSGIHVVAVKRTGQSVAVPLGKINFQGDYTSKSFPVKVQVASPGYVDPHWIDGTVQIRDNNHFVITSDVGTTVYTRIP